LGFRRCLRSCPRSQFYKLDVWRLQSSDRLLQTHVVLANQDTNATLVVSLDQVIGVNADRSPVEVVTEFDLTLIAASNGVSTAGLDAVVALAVTEAVRNADGSITTVAADAIELQFLKGKLVETDVFAAGALLYFQIGDASPSVASPGFSHSAHSSTYGDVVDTVTITLTDNASGGSVTVTATSAFDLKADYTSYSNFADLDVFINQQISAVAQAAALTLKVDGTEYVYASGASDPTKTYTQEINVVEAPGNAPSFNGKADPGSISTLEIFIAGNEVASKSTGDAGFF